MNFQPSCKVSTMVEKRTSSGRLFQIRFAAARKLKKV